MMTLLAINISEKLFKAMKELIETGKYESPDNFLEIAAFNQLALERGATPSDVIARGHRNVESSGNLPEKGNTASLERARSEKPPARISSPAKAYKPRAGRISRQTFVLEEKPTEDVAKVFEPFALTGLKEEVLKPCDPVINSGANGEHVFGQVNRLFPLKLACRWITRTSFFQELGHARNEWPVYTVITDTMADHAATLGSLLEKWDVAARRKRDDQLATGLPRRGNSASKDRFVSQFLARITRASDIYPGAICQYQLARFQGERLALTHQGLQFALLKNPILESADPSGSVALSDGETDFLVRQILDWVPHERDDMQIILTAIADGKATPGALTDTVQARFPRDWTESMTLTHISGLIARLADLHLVRRRWQGRNVEYELGEHRRVDAFLNPSA